MEPLIAAINTTPIIDHHAHNLLLPTELEARQFLSITTEAEGAAQEHATSTLAHLRAVKQLSAVLGCEPDWTAVQEAVRAARDRPDDAWAKQCFDGIQTVLIDDGLDRSTVFSWEQHNRLVPAPCKRIVRIEVVAEAIIAKLFGDRGKAPQRMLLDRDYAALASEWFKQFEAAIVSANHNPDVAGFKSVICYRTGLNIPDTTAQVRGSQMVDVVKAFISSKTFPRLQDARLSPFFVHATMKVLSTRTLLDRPAKPFQFHTGLGDNDIRLNLASPSHMQPFIEQYPEVPIVLLHAAYPFTKEAGYLASVYANCYLDIGEVFPFVSQEGQESVIRESLELCPSEKLMWSTDGHWYPETYLLAVLQVREGLTAVLTSAVEKGHMDVRQGVRIVEDILFHTANRLYDLRLILDSKPKRADEPPPYLESTKSSSSSAAQTSRGLGDKNKQVPQASPSADAALDGYSYFTAFLASNPTVKFLRMTWLDYTSTPRLRILPLKTAISLFRANKTLALTQACLGLLQNDIISPGFGPVGEYDIVPVFSSLRLCERDGWATVACEFSNVDEKGRRQEVDICPRTLLRRAVQRGADSGLDFLVGFEIEVVFTQPSVSPSQSGSSLTSQAHGWSVAASLHPPTILPLLEDITAAFEKTQVPLVHLHPEAAPGQFEFILEALPPLEAVDTLLAAKESIASIAARHSLRATCVPKPYPMACGTGAHIHTSLTPPHASAAFYAGVLRHLRAIAVFSLPSDDSYARMQDGCWAGGRWVSWGTKNKEGALRRIEGSHWELKWCDGFANFYLALAAYLAAGTQGVEEGLRLRMQDCTRDPALMTAEEREGLGVTEQIWADFDAALAGLEADGDMKALVGAGVVEAFVNVKRAEMAQLRGMGEEQRRRFLVERY